MTERFFAPCPRGLEAGARGGADGARRDVSSRRRMAASAARDRASSPTTPTSSRGSRAASSGRSRTGAIATRTSSTRSRKRSTGESTSPPRARCASTSRRRARPLTSLEFATLKVKDAVCDRFRADTGVRPSIDKERPDVRVHAYLTEREATLYLDTSGERALQARLAARRRHGAAARESRGRRARARRMGAGHAVARPDVRRRHDRDRGGARGRGYRARAMQRTFGFQKLAWYDGPTWQRIRQRARDRTRAGSVRAVDLRERHRSARGRAMPPQRRRRGSRGVDRHRAKPTRSRGPRPAPSGLWSPIRPTA